MNLAIFLAEFGLTDLEYYQYLSYGGNHKVDGINDARDFQETLRGTRDDMCNASSHSFSLRSVWSVRKQRSLLII